MQKRKLTKEDIDKVRHIEGFPIASDEDIIALSDPALRKSLGVFYTPAEAVRYLVRHADRIFVEDLEIKGGFSCNDTVASPSVMHTPLRRFQAVAKRFRQSL